MTKQPTDNQTDRILRNDVTKGTWFCIIFVLIIFFGFGSVMGIGPMFSTIMKTAHELLLNVVFYIMGVAVLAGAVSAVFSEFGVTALLNRVISPIMKPIFGLPGAAALGLIATFFSDNPAIVPMSKDQAFARYFKKYQWASLVNFGTTFGMGIVIVGGVLGINSGKYSFSLLIGFICAFIGGIFSTRLLMHFTKKMYGPDAPVDPEILSNDGNNSEIPAGKRVIRTGNPFQRGLNATFDGGKAGVELGMALIPGVIVFCTFVMMLTNGPSIVHGHEVYLGKAYEGVGLLPWIGKKLSFILNPLFGFNHNEVIGLPLTSLGAVGASLAGATSLAANGLMTGHDMAVYIAMGYCWCGFFSTTPSITDSMNLRDITTKAMGTQFLGGIIAGVVANYLWLLIQLF
ncbi:CD0519/CD1768 family membrane protein [Xylocopilactobacillus apis]|uniref:Transporter gate domain protein n=1 Tax=Xylocopilactobacillus apis TaxID=2932183 RepID=A0AAU9DCV9_9LACO|nr:hypothetical protein [Xylocopilactobacillus apis]BDR55981.1 hypothetical protein KIMC2_05430 [Xylocopilactobacillus apis]